MKYYNSYNLFYFILLFLLSETSSAQINLVPNPSFEDTIYCPYDISEILACANWLNFGNTPDYFNACSDFQAQLPNTVFGEQNANSGFAMAGLIVYANPQLSSGIYREFIGCQLIQPLSIGQKYYLSLFINFTKDRPHRAIASNHLGINFSTIQYDSCCPPLSINSAVIDLDTIYSDTVNWYKISGSFIADSQYVFLGIGNYFDNSNTDTIQIDSDTSQLSLYSYYFIDDVCVSTDSLYNETWTETKKVESKVFKFFPNPTDRYLFCRGIDSGYNISVYNLFGTLIYTNQLLSDSDIDLISFPAGVYIVSLFNNKSSFTQKIILTH